MQRKEDLHNLNERIKKKIMDMDCFDKFLSKVISKHSDEFQEPQDIVSRYKTLKESNDRLKKS